MTDYKKILDLLQKAQKLVYQAQSESHGDATLHHQISKISREFSNALSRANGVVQLEQQTEKEQNLEKAENLLLTRLDRRWRKPDTLFYDWEHSTALYRYVTNYQNFTNLLRKLVREGKMEYKKGTWFDGLYRLTES